MHGWMHAADACLASGMPPSPLHVLMAEQERAKQAGGDHEGAGGLAVWAVLAPFRGSPEREAAAAAVIVHNVNYHTRVSRAGEVEVA